MLDWGRHLLMASPDHFRVEYSINPWMRAGEPVDRDLAHVQWDGLRTTFERLGARVDVLPARPDAPDLVFAMNLGLVDASPGRPRVVLSHMRHPERRVESASAAHWFAGHGFEVVTVGADGVGPYVEAGDAFPYADTLVVGFGLRTGRDALEYVASALDVRVQGVRLRHPALYHLDLAFCPLDERRAMVCPEAFEPASARALLELVPEPLVLTVDDAYRFTANSVVLGTTVVMPACPARVRAVLEGWGFEVVLVPLSELHRGGGSARCLANPLDWRLDAARVPGGEVRLPRPDPTSWSPRQPATTS